MTSRLLRQRARLAPLLAGLMLASTVLAQQPTPNFPALSEVDPVEALSRYLRMLAANPRDLASLTGAGRAALAVGDANAALGFYARAEEIAPRNGRIKAGLATALVQMEQPRTALKLFDEAVALGVPAGEIAADRGLAHDLVGDNRTAQTDYTLALRTKDDDETLRRLALSMAIAGDRTGALTMLDPLLRRSDSGAVRARAFILALTGDQAGATKVVQAAMPGPQAAAMATFLGRLRALNPAQKALAVNFGYFPSDGRSYNAAELFADARSARPTIPAASAAATLVPAGAPLGARFPGADAGAPLRPLGEIAIPAEVPPPAHVLAAPIPGRTTPVPGRPAVATASAAPSSTTATPVAAAVTAPTRPLQAPLTTASALASTAVVPPPSRASLAASEPAVGSTSQPSVMASAITSPPATRTYTSVASLQPAAPIPAAATQGPNVGSFAMAVPTSSTPGPVSALPAASGPLVGSPAGAASGSGAASTQFPVSPAAPTGIATVDLPASITGPVSRRPEPNTAPSTAEPTRLAALVPTPARVTRSATKPDAETRELAASKPAPTAKPAASAKPEAVKSEPKQAAVAKSKADAKADTAAKSDPKAKTSAAKDSKADTKAKPDPKDGKNTRDADKSKAEAKSKADAKGKAADAKAKSEPAKPKTEERYWVQVASGSNKANLDKAWTNVKAKAPALLNGRSTYTAPWRASNRLLIGPFKSEEEAQAEVNRLGKAGVGGIQFTSRAGVDVEKVAAK